MPSRACWADPPRTPATACMRCRPAAGPSIAKQKGNWVFAALSPEGLKNTPDDPLPLLGDLPKKYSVAAKLIVGNIPPALREMVLNRLKQVPRPSSPPRDEGPSLDQQWGKVSGSLTATLDDLDEVTLGLAVDATAQKSYLELTVMAKDGTKLAEAIGRQRGSEDQLCRLSPARCGPGAELGAKDVGRSHRGQSRPAEVLS